MYQAFSRVIRSYIDFLNSSRYRQLFFFFLSVLIIIIAKNIQFPILTFNAEMFGENGTNFFYNAYEHSLITNLFATDAGYLPWTQRLIAVILVKVFHIIQFYPYVSQALAILLIAIFSSLVNFDVFKKLNSSALIRFIIGIAIGLISDFELNVFINFIYFGALFLLFAIIINKEKLTKPLLILLCFASAIIMLSKGQFISFIPIFVLMACIHFKRKQYQSFAYYLIGLSAGLLQLFVMTTNLPGNNSSLSLVLLPYYCVKTLYYLLLTYRHVFFGFITKEGINFISIGLLLVLFTIGIKNLMYKKDKFTLNVFLAGNFIALCSLFITITFYSLSNPNVVTITQTAKQTPSIVAATGKITNEVYENAQNTKNIFDVKHHANARALFISNALIFLVGIFVLLKIFPRQRDRFVFLLIIFLTSGAFGQVQTEQMYMNKSQSYSQWQTYYNLLNNNQYCIPINNYPFLLRKNCDYLLSRSVPDIFSPMEKVPNIALSRFTQHSEDWEIKAVILINKPNQFLKNEAFSLVAYNKNGKAIGKARQLVPSNYEFVYYIFDKPLSSVDKLSLRSRDDKEVKVSPSIIVLGNDKKVAHRKVEY